ncbi:hypothetical protein QQ020_13115 [Fulvivirgaceae bacterium BMA12]|uniref:Uncharacterized protein n=1 Tax=Agaribacillus aureus TaxID=3051825 RepID=A0ABT8L5J4_9BACT|nr:hypothetical protein [Fulvivirgaceae bacterium BMA12]
MMERQRELISTGKVNNLQIAYKALIEPLISFIHESENSFDQRTLQIIPHVMECDLAFQTTKKLREQKRRGVLIYGRELLSIRTLLNDCVRNIKKRKHYR